MSTEFAEMYASVTADVTDFIKKMDSVEAKVSGFDKPFKGFSEIATGAFRRIGELGVEAVGRAVSGIVDLGKNVISTGVQFNNLKEQANIAFTTMLGSGEEAKGFLDELQDFAAKTPFDFPELLQASQRMLAMGMQSDKVLPTLTAIGDAVAGLGGSSELVGRVTTALGQMQAKGKATGEEMMQLTEAGIPAWEFLAKKIGVSIPDAMAMVTKGAVSADAAIGALTDGMNAKFGGMMEKQSATFGGLWSTIQDTFQQISGQVMEPFFNLMTRGLQMIVDFTSSADFTAGIEAFTRVVEIAAQAVGVFFDDLFAGESIIDSVTHALAILLPPSVFLVWKDFVGIIDWVTVQFTALMDVIQGKTPIMTYLGNVWANAWGAVQNIFGTVVSYVQTNLPKWVASLQEWAKAAWEWIADAAPKVAQALGNWASGIIQWIGARLPDFIATVYKWATALVDWITDAIPKAVGALTNFVRGLREGGDSAGGEFGGMVGKWATTLWSWIKDDLIPKVGPAFMEFAGSLLNYGRTLLTSLGGLAYELGVTLWDWIVKVTPTAIAKLREWGGKLWDWIKDNSPEWGRKLGEWATAAWEWITKVTPVALKKLSDWGAELWNWVKEQAPTWKDKLSEWAGIAWKWITETAIPEVKKKIADWGTALWDWVKENAPTWRDKLGEWAEAAWEWITKTAIPEAVKKLKEWGAALINWVNENKQGWIDKFKETGTNIIQGLWDGIEIMWIRLSNWFFSDTAFGGFIGDILQVLGVQLGPAYGVLYKNGEKIAYSLNEGSRYGLPALQKTGSDMGSAISTGLEQQMDMNSPSRRMWGYGQDIAAGLAMGVKDGAVYVKQTLEDYSVVWQNIVTGQWIDYFSEAGRKMAHSVGAGLKSETQWVAEQVGAMVERAHSEMLQRTEYFTNQMMLKIQMVHRAIANGTKDVSNIVQQYKLDPATLPASMGGTGKVVGTAAGHLILEGIDKRPTTVKRPPAAPYAEASKMLEAMDNWLKFTLSEKDPLNDWLAHIKDMIHRAPLDVQRGVDDWLKFWQKEGDWLNDSFDNVRRLVSSKVADFADSGISATMPSLASAPSMASDYTYAGSYSQPSTASQTSASMDTSSIVNVLMQILRELQRNGSIDERGFNELAYAMARDTGSSGAGLVTHASATMSWR